MNNLQQKAIEDFNKFGYLIVNAPRRSGKTILLQEIIKQNQDKKIGVQCLNYRMFKCLGYDQFINCIYVENNKDVDILIGDEVFIEPIPNIRTACALTPRYYIHKWNDFSAYVDKDGLIQLQKEMTEEKFRCEFF